VNAPALLCWFASTAAVSVTSWIRAVRAGSARPALPAALVVGGSMILLLAILLGGSNA
jgi:hypothetical protein